jgi:predicted TIM-barrel fold metal-dependent hydrolase
MTQGPRAPGRLNRSVLRVSLVALLGCALGCSAEPQVLRGSPQRAAQATLSAPLAAKDQAAGGQPTVAVPSVMAPEAGAVPFVDAHVHLNDEGMQREMMRRFGAERAVVFWGGKSDNESVADAARRHPDVFIAFASISPERGAYRRAWDTQDTGLLKTLDELLASGRFKGIGEISAVHFPSPGLRETDYDPMGPMMSGILALARRYRVPVMVHIEVTRLKELSSLLGAFHDVPVIWAHGGYTPLFLARRMLERHANLYYELSARTWPRHPRSPDYTILRDGESVWPEWLALIESMPERFIVGTDASQRSRESEIMKHRSVQALLRQLSPATQERVARGNLLSLVERER